MKDIKATQFDPGQPYPEWAFAFGPHEFYCSSPRGHIRLSKSDWIIEFETGERVVVSDETHQRYFKEPEPDEKKPKILRSRLSVTNAAKAAANLTKGGNGPAEASAVAGEDSESGEPGDAA